MIEILSIHRVNTYCHYILLYMNILIVTGHPKKENHTIAIADTYKSEVERLGHQIKTIDVYGSDFVLPYMSFEKDSLDAKDINKIKKMQEMITWANEIVIVHPVWWASMPAGLKNWVDAIFCPHFAYQYNEKGKPCPLLVGKTAKIFATAGSYAPYYLLPIISFFTPLHLIWKYAVLEFAGIELVEMKIIDKMNVNAGAPPIGSFEKFLKKVKKSARKRY